MRIDEGGGVRVGKGRISLDLIVEEHENGMSAEDMVRAYDALVLAEVEKVIAFYLQHREAVCSYLARRAEEAADLRARIEAEHPRISAEDLKARRAAKEFALAPPRQ